MTINRYDVIYKDKTVKNIDAYTEESARKIADIHLNDLDIKDEFVEVKLVFNGIYVSNI